MNSEPSLIWWESIAGPLQLVSSIGDALHDGKNVILRHPGFIPWQGSLQDLVGGFAYMVSINREIQKESLIPRILEEFHRKYAVNCPAGYKNQIDFVKAQHIFQGNTIWISVEDDVSADQIIRFISDYRGDNYDAYGAFVLLISETAPIPMVSDSVQVICYRDYVKYGSLRLFSSLIAESVSHIPEEAKSYAAAVAASLCDPDPELIPELLNQTNFSTESPDVVLTRLWENRQFLDPDRTSLSSKWYHPFDLIRRNESEQFERRIWCAQLQTLFPEIELERAEIIKQFFPEIETALNTRYWDKKQERFQYVSEAVHYSIDSPYDVEIGTLAFMLTLSIDREQHNKLLYLPDQTLRERISFLRNCRNNLAHITPCSAADVSALLTYQPSYDHAR